VEKDYLVLKRASASRPSGDWNDDDFDVLANGVVVGRIFKANASPRQCLMDVDISLRPSRGPQADTRLRGDARRSDGSIR
jgi:hypothetical protein